MTDIPPTAVDLPPGQGFDRSRAFRSIGLSIFVNAVCPYLIYRYLEPQYPAGNLTPLLASTVFPLLGLVFGLVRSRTADVVAIISLVEIAISIAVVLVASNITLALVARALQGTLTGVFFIATALIGRPLMYYAARQFVAVSGPVVLAGFERANALDRLRTFRNLTILWGVVAIVVSVANVWLATHVSPATYLFVAPILGIGSNMIMAVWTIRHSTRSLARFRGT
jgi:hypothetical protein